MPKNPARLFQPVFYGLFVVIALVIPLSAQADKFGEISVKVAAPPKAETEYGYAEYRATITNHSTKSHEIAISFDGRYGNGMIEKLSKTTAVPAQSTASVSLFQPFLPLGIEQVNVQIDGQQQINPITISNTSHGRNRISYYWSPANLGIVLASREIMTPLASRMSSTSLLTLVQNPDDVPQWSSNWLGYTSYTAVALTGREWERMPESVRTAVRRYVLAGGVLLMLDPGRWPYFGEETSSDKSLPYGFGLILRGQPNDISNWLSVCEATESRNRSMWCNFTIEESHSVFPVIKQYGIPARSILALLVLFALVIGPLNFVVLAIKKRRMWLLWTVPAISLVASLGIFIYAALSEGWTTKVRCETVTYLDQRSHEAATYGYLGVYSTFTPSDGLHFSQETEVWADLQSEHDDPRMSQRTIDLSQDQHFKASWVSARVPAYFKVRKSEACRQRLVTDREPDGSLFVTNGLGATLIELHLTDKDGRGYSASNIRAGDRVKLTPIPDQESIWKAEILSELIAQDWRSAISSTMQARPRLHRPNSYVALLEGTPFMEQPMPDAAENISRSAVIGVLED
ncbi:MAG: hypothetical protein IT444_05445 [Phycisphaeraceae bacterium]|nr:hypothetical protein [Phycisphaeraceae bacterium]